VGTKTRGGHAAGERRRRRFALTADDGTQFLLDLPEAPRLREGDGLLLERTGVVEVRAAPERLLELACADAAALVRLAWHLGNRHVPAELRPGAIRIREDHVLAEMAVRLGARVAPLEAPFDPEGGAYAGAGHAHGHHHDDDHHHPHEETIADSGRVVAFRKRGTAGDHDH
jgi:urease accessory protein